MPKSGGTTIKDYYGRCVGLVEAAESGTSSLWGHGSDQEIGVFKALDDQGSIVYANVDVSNGVGVERAQTMGLIPSGLADIIFSPLDVAAPLFEGTGKQGRCFALLRDPIERALSMFHYLQVATWEPTYNPKLKNMTLVEYNEKGLSERDWMVRFLSGKTSGPPPLDSDLIKAKEVLRRKCVVGIMDKMEESIIRFNKYFGWEGQAKTDHAKKCAKTFIGTGGGANRNKAKEKGSIEERVGTKAFKLMLKRNPLDTQLYEYALHLFEKQASLIGFDGDVSERLG